MKLNFHFSEYILLKGVPVFIHFVQMTDKSEFTSARQAKQKKGNHKQLKENFSNKSFSFFGPSTVDRTHYTIFKGI